MHFDNFFTVSKAIDEVWSMMLDLERVVPCVPDARVVEKTGDVSVKAEIKIRLGPMLLNYTGPAEIVEQDPKAHRAVLAARAREKGGQGNADARVEINLDERDGATAATLHSDVNVVGKAAAMGASVIGGVTEAMIASFAENLAAA